VPKRAVPAAETALAPERLFAPLVDARGLVLAVSGGADSTALMALVARWRGRPPALVACVDHGLRPEAAAEAQLVAANAERLGLPWRILTAPKRTQPGNLQDWARRARYALLTDAARDAGFDTIVTAHHRDDQAETFLLRLARGSGVYGLGSMPDVSDLEGLRLVRPLLGVAPAELAEIAAESGLPTVADPSNDDRRFERVRMRGLLPELAKHGLTAERLAETAARMQRAATALDFYARKLLSERFAVDRFGVVAGPASAVSEVPEEVALRALALLVAAAGGAEHTPPLDSLEALHAALAQGGDVIRWKRTLHGVELTLHAGRLTARREWGRAGPAALAAPAGASLVWDRRFRVSVPLGGGLAIGPLGRAERRLWSPGAERATLAVLPGLFRDGELVAAPASVAASDRGANLASLPVECLVAARLAAS
jgi:tRNA(Ile)-lysidine synthase